MSLTGAINSFRDGLNQWLSIILKLAFIAGIVLFIMWMGLSVFANATENKGLPSVAKAQHEFFIKATGESLLTDDYDIVGNGSYILHGFYRLDGGKWRYQKVDFTLNEEYWGTILVRDR